MQNSTQKPYNFYSSGRFKSQRGVFRSVETNKIYIILKSNYNQ